MATFDGDSQDDRKLWHTYLYWARERAMASPSAIPVPGVIVDDPVNRVDSSIGKSLQAILFSSFALEYRLKRILISMNVSFPKKETMGRFLKQFWSRLQAVARLDGCGNCSAPASWQRLEPHLKRLVDLRNSIAHANYMETLNFLSVGTNPEQQTRDYYNYVVDAIRLVNEGTGCDTRSNKELNEYFKPLKV
jgi:hypothetical protein